MDIWLAIKIQAVVIAVVSFFLNKISVYLFLATVNEEEIESIKKELGKPIRNHVIFFYVNAVMMRAICLVTTATFFAVIIKDWL